MAKRTQLGLENSLTTLWQQQQQWLKKNPQPSNEIDED